MKSIFNGSAIVASALLVGSLMFSAVPSAAETPFKQDPEPQAKTQDPKTVNAVATEAVVPASDTTKEAVKETVAETKEAAPEAAEPPVSYLATAYSLRGRTASGKPVSKGIIAADPRVLPLGSRVHVHAGGYTGEYIVADTGGKIRGRRIDIWIPSSREAMRFGRRTVKLTVLSYGGKRGRKVAPKVATPVVATPLAAPPVEASAK